MTIDRDALARILRAALGSGLLGRPDADAAFAALAELAAVPVEGEVEWEYAIRASGLTWPAIFSSDNAARAELHEYGTNAKVVRRRKAGPWQEVTL